MTKTKRQAARDEARKAVIDCMRQEIVARAHRATCEERATFGQASMAELADSIAWNLERQNKTNASAAAFRKAGGKMQWANMWAEAEKELGA